MTIVVYSLAAAVLYGIADFVGGVASRRSRALAVVLVSTPAGLISMLVASLMVPGTPSVSALAYGAVAGAAGGLGIFGFYAALAAGPMSVVAPVSALTAALLPVGFAIAIGERLSSTVLFGAVLCLVAITLVAMERDDSGRRTRPGRGAVLAFFSGASFGLFLVLIKFVPADSGMWSLAAARTGGLAVVVAIALFAGVRPATGRVTIGLALAAGVVDSLANVAYLLASREGLLSLAAVITSLYPAVTVLLARLIYSERLRRVQLVGLALAVTGVVMVSAY